MLLLYLLLFGILFTYYWLCWYCLFFFFIEVIVLFVTDAFWDC